MSRALKYGNDYYRIAEREETWRIQHLDGKMPTKGIHDNDPPSLTFVELKDVFRFGKPLSMGQSAWMNSLKRASS